MTCVLTKRGKLGDRRVHRENATWTWRPSTSQGEEPGAEPLLTALKRNELCSHFDLRLLGFQTQTINSDCWSHTVYGASSRKQLEEMNPGAEAQTCSKRASSYSLHCWYQRQLLPLRPAATCPAWLAVKWGQHAGAEPGSGPSTPGARCHTPCHSPCAAAPGSAAPICRYHLLEQRV